MKKHWFSGEPEKNIPPPAEQPDVVAEIVPDKAELTPSQKKIAEDIQSTLDELEQTRQTIRNAPLDPKDFRNVRSKTASKQAGREAQTETPEAMKARVRKNVAKDDKDFENLNLKDQGVDNTKRLD